MANPALLVAMLVALAAPGCATPRVADPSEAVAEYASAARRGDADALHAMLSERSRRDLGIEGTRRIVLDSRAELRRQGEALARATPPVEAVAIVRYDDGEHATLELEDGTFKVGSVAALPAAPRTPVQALDSLRQALARRSYSAFVRVLSAETQSALETEVAAIVRGLEEPETLEIDVRGDGAQVELPGGHVVKLKRERGVWRIEDLR